MLNVLTVRSRLQELEADGPTLDERSAIGGNLVDHRFERVTIGCSVCAPKGVYEIKTVRSVHCESAYVGPS